ncbi:response regulator [Rariglobus hedericola]|uniref:Response regulator n=1 Tax=Rariglobus hedericola TaxID=2597822 RepID=A0A556QK76_9BACT|nr:response regulator [Rariglobus hedericola]TSJ77028.1 response regulator [Rariglobus hedericola]
MRPHILVIDDSKAVRLIALKALAPFDCDVAEATNGFTGLFAMERVLPDLILLDIAMSTMNGDTMLEMMRSNDQLKKLPVIMMVSRHDHKVLPKITALGVSSMIEKPFSETALLEAVREVIKLKPVARKPSKSGQ